MNSSVGTIDEERHLVDILVLQSIKSSDYGLGTKLFFQKLAFTELLLIHV